MSQVYCVLDYETFSEADLRRVGAFEYSAHPSTDILCAAWTIGTRAELTAGTPVQWWSPLTDGGNFGSLYQALLNPEIILVAHNALFEQVITRNVFAAKHMYSRRETICAAISPQRWLCTASLASALALPRNLEGAANALNLPVKKDTEGRKLMLKWCKPRRASKKNASLRHTDAAELERLIEYCITDVRTEVALFLAARPLIPLERKVWELDQKINLRGFAVDRPLVTTILDMIDDEVERINVRTGKLTKGAVRSATQRAQVLKWLEGQGVYLPNLTKATVDAALADGLCVSYSRPHSVLKMRQAISKTSTAKYEAFDKRSRFDGRCRDILVYHAASPGRWGGAGVQPQNFPRGNIGDSVQAAEILAEGDVEMVRLIYGNVMDVFSSCLRNMIIAPPGRVLHVADYSAIEVRVLFWLAGDKDGVRAFVEGRDLYKELAVDIYPGQRIDRVTSDQRFVGKTATLGCGYQMGWERFKDSCKSYGVTVPEELARTAVKAYRVRHTPVVKLWAALEYTAIAAVETPGKEFETHGLVWYCRRDFLFCRLPSGREIAYRSPSVRMTTTDWGQARPQLTYMGVDALSKKWQRESTYGGKLTENVVQAIARDVMASAMLRLDESGWEIVLTVHDEVAAEAPENSPTLTFAKFKEIMETLPAWADGMPLKAAGFESKRYRK